MRVNPQRFFDFCARHVPLLRALEERSGDELSPTEILRLIRHCAMEGDEQPDTVTKRLTELQIIIPVEEGSEFYLVAEPVVKLLRYLWDETKPATSEMIRGYINSLDEMCRQLRHAMENEDVTQVGLAVAEIGPTLRRIYDDVAATHASILNEVARFKTDRHPIAVREKFRRIVYWMERYVMPMVEIIRVDGVMEATFAETDRLLRSASEQTLFNDLAAVERNVRLLRLVRRHALRVFEQCRKEIQPLYQSLARSNNIAAGAAVALERLRRDGVREWEVEAIIGVLTLRQQNAITDAAISVTLERVICHPPPGPPVMSLNRASEEPAAMRRRRWLDSLLGDIATNLPVDDLLDWLITRYPRHPTADVLAGFSTLVFHDTYCSQFAKTGERSYETDEHMLRAHPVRLERRKP